MSGSSLHPNLGPELTKRLEEEASSNLSLSLSLFGRRKWNGIKFWLGKNKFTNWEMGGEDGQDVSGFNTPIYEM